MKVLVTGASGFTGVHMHAHLARRCGADHEVWGLARGIPQGASSLRWKAADLRDPALVDAAIRTICPDMTLHLAALTTGSDALLHAVNVQGTENLLAAHRRHAPKARILVVSSSAVYGNAGEQPVPEDTPLHPLTAYGKSKCEQELCALAYHRDGMNLGIARPFNLAGPGQSPEFVCGNIVRQVCAIHAGRQEAIHLRDRSSCRDFVDVRDAVRAYWELLTFPGWDDTCAGHAFNVGSERAFSVGTLITVAEDITGTRYPTEIEPDSGKPQVPVQVSDCTRIRSLTGWRAEIPLPRTMKDMIRAACAGLKLSQE
jgi:GDP-4-dehydro-6-deoxy-D-mannose reductase